MAEFKVGRSITPVGVEAPAALAEDRVTITRDSILQWKMEGRVFFAQQGNAGTALDFVELAYDEDQPQFAILVPTGVLMIPLSMNVSYTLIPQAAMYHVWSTTTNDIGNGTSVELTPVNYRRDAAHPPTCKARSVYTADATAATGLIEVKRFYHPYAAAGVTDSISSYHGWSIYDPDMPILLGPATLQMHTWSGTDGPTGFGEYTWVEFDAAEVGL